MADVTITQLTVNNNLSAVNYIPISDGTNTTRLGSNSLFGARNRLINGGFNIAQRGTSVVGVTNDYTLDRWRLVTSDGVSITVDQPTNPFTGAINSMKMANGAQGQRFGVYQIIESANCRDLRGKQVTLSFKLKTSDPSIPAPIAVSIIEYTGTADSVPTNIFSSMPINAIPVVRTAGGFIATSQTAITPSAANAWYTIPPITTTLGSSFNNLLIALTWMNSSSPSSANKNFELAQVQLEEGPTATPFEFRPVSTELAMCQRYYQKTYEQSVTPGTASRYNAVSHVYNTGTYQNIWWRLPVTMRARPNTLSAYNPETGTAGELYNSTNSTSYAINMTVGAAWSYTSDSMVMGRSSINQSVQNELNVHFTASAEL